MTDNTADRNRSQHRSSPSRPHRRIERRPPRVSSSRATSVVLGAAASVVAALAPSVADAQAGDERRSPTTLPAVTVTERSRGEAQLDTPNDSASRLGLTPLQTPASVEVLTGTTVRDRGDQTISAAVSRATGITMSPAPGNGGSALGARGFVGHNSVMQLYDGTRFYVGAGTVTFPFDT